MNPAEHPETVRQRYLRAMGITLWLPRQPLPGAAESPAWQWQSLASLDAAAAGSKPEKAESPVSISVEPPESARNLRALVGLAPKTHSEAPSRRESTDKNAAGASAVKPVAAPAEVPHFRILVARFGDCLVLDDLPLDPRLPVTPSHQALLMAILDAVGLGKGELKEQIATWPLFAADSGHDQSLPVARQLLQQDVGLAELPADQPILLLGNSAAAVLLEPSDPRRFVVRGPSLNEMLRIPARKADLWRALQPLRDR